MNVDFILSTFNDAHADYILIGGMNFFLNHQPVLTWDIDLWISSSDENIEAVQTALARLQTEVSFDRKGDDWQSIGAMTTGAWLKRSAVHCLNSPHGPIDIFSEVPGLEAGFEVLKPKCPVRRTPSGIPYRSLSDELMIQCQLALSPSARKLDRLRALGYNVDKL